jgi:hypothetical protein
MRSLIWKEVRQQLGWLFVALALAAWLWFRAASVWDQLVRAPNETALWSLAIPLLYAFALAQLQFGRDGDSRHFGLLVHRRSGARGYFASKLVVGLAALATVVVLPVAIWALAMSLSDPDALLIRWVRVPQVGLLCVPALLVYALGVLSTQLRRGALMRWGVAIVGLLGAFLVAWPLTMVLGMGRAWVYAWVGVDLLLAAAVLWLARSLLLAGRDRDLALRDRQLAGVAVVAFLFLLPLASFVLGTAGAAALAVIVEEKPAVLVDPRTDELVVALRTEDGWRRRDARAGEAEITKKWDDQFCLDEEHVLDLVHYAGSPVVEGADEAREALKHWSACRQLSDPAPRRQYGEGAMVVAVRAEGEARRKPGERWTVQFELDEEDGTVHVDASRAVDGLPPLCVRVPRPGGRFSSQAGFLEFSHAPLVLDRTDGTVWRIELREDGALAEPLALPGDDRVEKLEPLFQRKQARLGRFELQCFSSEEFSSGYLFVGRAGSYALLDGQLVRFSESVRPKDSVTYEEALRLARFATTSSWPDAFTEELRVERLADHQTVFETSSGPSTRAARMAAAGYAALAFLRAPGGVLKELLWGRKLTMGRMNAPFPKEMQLFERGGHALLFALLMLSGAFQLFLGWRWLARAGAGLLARIVYMLLILVGGVAALLFTRVLLPRHARSTPVPERSRAQAPLPARA